MKRQIICLMLSVATLSLTVGCLYPDRYYRRDQRHGPGRDQGQDNRRDRERDRDHQDRH